MGLTHAARVRQRGDSLKGWNWFVSPQDYTKDVNSNKQTTVH